MKQNVYTLGLKEVQGKTTPIMFDYDTNQLVYTMSFNYANILAEKNVKEVLLYCYIDGIVRIMNTSYETIKEVKNLSDAFNTDVRFVEVFPYNTVVEHNEDESKNFTIITYIINLLDESFDFVSHTIALLTNNDYASNTDDYHIYSVSVGDYIGDTAYANCDITSLLEENITNVLTTDDDDDDLVVYPSDGTTLTFKLLDGDIYVQLNSFYKEHDRFFVPFLKLPINMANELNNIVNWSID